ncbi:hypothetical protein LPJ71_003772, partial [Coemansia sp. S17]
MSSTVSPAQRLPFNVVQSILKYTAPQPLIVCDLILGELYTVKQLLSVCSIWRQVALERLWKMVYLSIDDEMNTVYIENPNWAKKFKLPFNAETIVRGLNIRVSMSGIVSGVAHQLLSEYMEDVANSLHVRNLNIMIADYPIRPGYTKSGAISNALEFAKFVKSMAREENTTVQVKYAGKSGSLSELVDDIFGMLVNSL